MEVKTTVDGNTATFEVEGKLTVQTSAELADIIESSPEEACNLAIDLTAVDYVSSSGLRVFMSASKLALQRGGSFMLLHPCDNVMDVLDITGLSGVFTIER